MTSLEGEAEKVKPVFSDPEIEIQQNTNSAGPAVAFTEKERRSIDYIRAELVRLKAEVRKTKNEIKEEGQSLADARKKSEDFLAEIDSKRRHTESLVIYGFLVLLVTVAAMIITAIYSLIQTGKEEGCDHSRACMVRQRSGPLKTIPGALQRPVTTDISSR